MKDDTSDSSIEGELATPKPKRSKVIGSRGKMKAILAELKVSIVIIIIASRG